MKAVVFDRQGGPEVLSYRDWPDPEPAADEVLVRVAVCGLNHLDVFVRRGMPGHPVPLPFITGGDIAGMVESVGAEAAGLTVGDRVVVNPSTPAGMLGEDIPGGMAELVAAPATHVIKLPDAVSFEEAACLPVAYGTARRMLFSRANVKPGDLVLVLGASGGVGNGAVQLANNHGAQVIACAGTTEKCERLRELGAHHVINYHEEDFSREAWRISGRKGVDVVVNFTGGGTWVPSLRALRTGGTLVTCGATAGFDPQTDIRYIWVRELNILGANGWTTEDIRALVDDVAAGRIKPIIDRTFPLAETRVAEELMEERDLFGKILLVP